jgi:fatty acid-binding protein DegV
MSICILTDNTAQLPRAPLPTAHSIKTIALRVEDRLLCAPTVDDFLRAFRNLEPDFDCVLVLTISSHLLPVADVARAAATQRGGKFGISVLDSMQTGAGLGILAQMGAQAAAEGQPLADVEKRIRAVIPHIYTLIHTDTIFRHTLQPAQTNDTTPPLPLFTLDEGQLSLYKNVRTRRNLLESFQEFIEEFEHPQQVAILRGAETILRPRALRTISHDLFPETPFDEREMSIPLMALFGAQSIEVAILETPVR